MAFLTGVVGVIDSTGKRIDTPDANGDHSPILLQTGPNMTAAAVPEGSLTKVTIDSVPGGGGGGGTVAFADYAAFRASTPTDGEVFTVKAGQAGPFIYSSTTGAGLVDDGAANGDLFATILKPTAISGGSNGRAYNASTSPVLPSIAALRLASSGKQASIQVFNYAKSNDGGGGIFDWASTLTTADNGGTIIAPTGIGTGRWVRRRSGAVDITNFGAIADCRAIIDASMSAGSAVLTSTAAAWTSLDVGKTVIVNGAKINTLSGTAATVAGSRGVTGTGTRFEQFLYQGAAIKIGGNSYTVGRTLGGVYDFFLTGTLAVSGGTAVVGTGTKFLTELYVGCVIGVYGGTVVASSDIPVPYLARVTAIADDTHCTTTLQSTGNAEGVAQSITGSSAIRWWYGDSTDLGGGVRAAQVKILVDPAPVGTASGLTVLGPPSPLVAKILSVAGNNATLDATADLAVSAALVHIGTGAATAINNAKANHDHVVMPPAIVGINTNATGQGFNVHLGTYLVESKITIDFTRKGLTLEWLSGAQWVTADTLVVNGTYNRLIGNWSGFAFGGGEGPDFGHPVTITYAGAHGRPIVQMADDSAHTCVGSSIFGVSVRQRCHVDTSGNEFSSGSISNRTGGVTGFRFGPYGVGGTSAMSGAAIKRLGVIDCYHGISVGGGSQSWTIQDVDIVRYNNGWVGGYSQGIGIGVGCDSDYNGGAACTAGLVTGHVLIQGNRIGGQLGNMFTIGPLVGTTDFSGKWIVENLPEIFPAYFVFAGCGKCSLLASAHNENETQPQRDAVLPEHAGPDGYSFVGVQIGAPSAANQGVCTELVVSDQYLNGGTSLFAGYSWNALHITRNHLDNQGASQGVNIRSALFRNFGGGAGRVNGVWKAQLQPGGGIYNTAADIYPSLTGFSHVETANPDELGVAHQDFYRAGTGKFDASVSPLYSGTKMLADETDIDGTVHYGDDAQTTVAVDSAAGQKVLNTTSVATLQAIAGQKITINEGGAREENIVIASIAANAITSKTNLVFTHTAAQADTVKHAIGNFVAKRTSYEWNVPPGGYGFTIRTDGSTIAHHYLSAFPATSSAVDKFTGISFTGSMWDATGTPQARDRGLTFSMERVSGSPFVTHGFIDYNGLRVMEFNDDGSLSIGPRASTHFDALFNAGSPEGVVTASHAICYDVTNNAFYLKRNGSGNTGWDSISVAPTLGTNLPDSDTTISPGGGTNQYKILISSANRTTTLGTASIQTNEMVLITSYDTTAHTRAIVNGGAGAGTLYTFPGSVMRQAAFIYDGTNYALAGHWAITL